MYISKDTSDLFANARQENRQIFREHWNRFIESRQLLAALIVYTVLQILFFVFSGGFIRRHADLIGLLAEPPLVWQKLAILGVQIVVNLPGILTCIGLWLLRSRTRCVGEEIPNLTGVSLIRRTNWVVSAVTGLLLGLYPTVIIYAGDYLKQAELTRVFYIFLCSTLLFAVSVTMLRLVFRSLEENISCCWSNFDWILPLIFAYGGAIVSLLIFMKMDLFIFVAALWGGAVIWILVLYRACLSRVASLQAQVEQKVIQSREKSYDPYSRY